MRSPSLGRTLGALLLLALLAGTTAAGDPPALPNRKDSVRFAIIGDSGTGGRRQYQVAAELAEFHRRVPFEFVLMLGDNLYGGESPEKYRRKFEIPYKPLLDAGVKFYASLGNHDEPGQRFYKLFNMDGRRYYTFTKGPVRFFALDSNYMDEAQLQWLEKELESSNRRWKIAFFHHPIYSSGRRHGSDEELRELLEPLFVKYGVNVVFSGHDHFYERINPQHGVYYFVSGNAGKVRRGNLRATALTAKGYDDGYSFSVFEIVDDTLHFQTVSRRGVTVDEGALPRLTSRAAVADTE